MSHKTQRRHATVRPFTKINHGPKRNVENYTKHGNCVWCNTHVDKLLPYAGGIAEPCGHSQGFIFDFRGNG